MDLINKFVGADGKKELEDVGLSLEKIADTIDVLNGKGIKIDIDMSGGGSLKDLTQYSKEAAKINKDLAAASKSYADAKLKEAKIVEMASKQQQQSDREAKREIDSYIKSVKDGQREIDNLAKQYEKLQKAQARLADKAAAKELKNQESAMKQAAASAAKYEKQMAAVNKETERLEAATRKEQAALERANRAYNLLDSAHKRLIKTAQDAGAEFGIESTQFLEASESANRLGVRLSAIDSKLGNHRRNVGNYASAWNGLSTSIGYLVSELPNAAQSPEIFFRSIGNNLLPLANNIGEARKQNALLIEQGKASIPVWKQVAGALLSWQTAIAVGITLMVAYGGRIVELFQKTDDLSKFNKKAAESFVDETAKLRTLNAEVEDASTSQERLKQIRDQFVKDHPATEKALSGELNLREKLANAIKLMTEALKEQAIIKAAEELITEETKKQLTSELDFVDNIIIAFKSGGQAALLGAAIGEQIANNNQKSADRINKYTDIIVKAQQKLRSSGLGKLLDPKDPKTPQAQDLTNTDISVQERINKANSQARKQELDEIASYNQTIYTNESESYAKRQEALSRYLSTRLDINELEQSVELANIQLNLNKIYEIEGKSAKERTNQEKTLLAQKEAFEAEKNALTDKFGIEENHIIRDATKVRINLLQEQAKKEHESRKKEFDFIGEERAGSYLEEQRQLIAQYSKGRINKEKFNNEMEALDHEFRLNGLKAQREYLADILLNEQITDDERIEYQRAYVKTSNDITEENNNYAEHQTEKKKAKDKDYWDAAVNLAKEGTEFLGALVDAATQKRLQGLQQEADAIKQNHDLEMQFIEASMVAGTAKEQALRDQTAKTRDALDKNRADTIRAQRRQAAFEKSAGISTALINGTLAVIRAFKDYAFPLSAIIAGGVAVATGTQVAKIASTPLPQYAKGTPSSGEGLAIVGEQGRELKIDPSGDVSLTSGTATVDYLKAGTQIIPNVKTEEILAGAQMGTLSGYLAYVLSKNNNKDVVQAITNTGNENTDRMIRAIGKNKPTAPPVSNPNWNGYFYAQFKR